jgi:hypothetical protein
LKNLLITAIALGIAALAIAMRYPGDPLMNFERQIVPVSVPVLLLAIGLALGLQIALPVLGRLRSRS